MAKIIDTKEAFISLCGQTIIPQEIMETFDGMDFVKYLNEYRRIVENVELTNVRTYSYKLEAPRLYNYYIGYFSDLHSARLKVNKNWLKEKKDEEWWTPKVEGIMTTVAKWTKRIFYMNEYEEKEERLAAMRKVLDEKGIQYIDDEEYQKEIHRKLKYAD